MIKKINKEEILKKTSKLNDINIQLKSEFVGLDDVIDEICNLTESWYLFPDIQTRPTVINLWGLTGVGKTSVVKRLFELLNIESILSVDIGEWTKDDSSIELKDNLSTQLRKIKNNNRPVFIFDEFQLGRTIDKDMEFERPGLRTIWDLIDTGNFNIVDNDWVIESIYKLFTKITYCVKNGVKSKNGSVVKNKSLHEKTLLVQYEFDDIEKKYYGEHPLIPNDNFWNFMDIWGERFVSEVELSEYINKLGDENSILKFIEETVAESYKPKEYDFKDAIIFIIGNLDNAYHIYDNMNPDIDADTLYEYTEKITLTNIKEALSKLYRPEQISRLGNNHIIYKSLNEKMYIELIDLELKKIIKKYKDKFNLDIVFDDSMKSILYKESVFPAQGARPVFSTIRYMVEGYLSKIISEIYKNDWKTKKIHWKYDKKYFIEVIGKKTHKLEYDIVLKVEKLRISKGDDKQALVAIHEAGHVLTSIFALNNCPKVVVSKTASESEGFTHIGTLEYESKGYLFNRVVTSLGGFLAEKLIFGKDNITSGSIGDFKSATDTLVNMLKSYGMGKLPLFYEHDAMTLYDETALKTNSNDRNDKEIEKLLKKAIKKGNRILKTNITLLLKIGEYLSDHSKMDETLIREYVEKYAVDKAVYKTKENYYDYKNIIKNKLKDD